MTEDQMAKRFQDDTAHHEMTILHDDGLYRHLRFRNPKRSAYWFDLVTWPGSLAVRGDVDGYMFTRIADMFEFFRGERINPHYWAEKTEGGRDSTKSYSEDTFKQCVIEEFKAAVESGGVPRGLGKAVREEILNNPDIYYEDGARSTLDVFEYGGHFTITCGCGESAKGELRSDVERWRREHYASWPGSGHTTTIEQVDRFRFTDTWEWDLKDYDWSFLWCCHAIVWGIGQYDAKRASLTPAGGAA